MSRMVWRVLCLMALLLGAGTPRAAIARVELPGFEPAARAYEQSLRERGRGVDVATLLSEAKRAEAEDRWPLAIERLEAAVGAAPEPFALWLRLATNLADRMPSEPRTLSAAILTYAKASNSEQEIEALLLVGRALRNDMTRLQVRHTTAASSLVEVEQLLQPATDVYATEPNPVFPGAPGERRASDRLTPQPQDVLERERRTRLAEAKALETRYLELTVAAHTTYQELFRLLNRTVSERREPFNELPPAHQIVRIAAGPDWRSERGSVSGCFEFNVALQSSPETYRERWIEVTQLPSEGTPRSASFDVTVSDRRLCIGKLAHGETYTIGFKKGMPTAGPLLLASPLRLERLRAPNLPATVQFRSAAYIVPTSGERTVPMETVNVARLGLELVRVSDRNIHRQIALRQIGANIRPRDLAALYDTFSEPIWKGEWQSDSGIDNRIRRTELPLFKLLEERRTWIRSASGRADTTPYSALGRAAGAFSAGSFYRDPASSQSPGSALWEPGVYALAARMPGATGDIPVQWFVFSDLGLTFYKGPRRLYLQARSLASGAPKAKVRVQLVAQSNRILAERETDDDGAASFDAALAGGSHGNKLAAILAYEDATSGTRNDFSFIDVLRDTLDLSRVGAGGREAPVHLDAFVYTDRGVYRPDPDPDHLVRTTILVRTPDGRPAPTAGPLRVVMRSSRGTILADAQIPPRDLVERMGGAALELQIPATAPLGGAMIEVFAPARPQPIGSAQIQIAHVRPDRARITFPERDAWRMSRDGTGRLLVEGAARIQYLYGRTAGEAGQSGDAAVRDATGELEVRVEKGEAPFGACYAGYEFGAGHEDFIPAMSRSAVRSSGPDGAVDLKTALPDVPNVSHPLKARITLTMLDSAGTLATHLVELPIPRQKPWLGLRHAVRSVDAARFEIAADIVALSPSMQHIAGQEVRWRLFQERTEFVWFRSDDSEAYAYRPEIGRTLVSEGTTRTSATAASTNLCGTPSSALPPIPATAGTFYLELESLDGERAGSRIIVGAANADAVRPEPHIAKLIAGKLPGSLGEANYKPGETAEFKLEAPFDGQVAAAVVADGEILQWLTAKTTNRQATLSIAEIPKAWSGRGLQLLASVFRSDSDGTEARGPARAIATLHFSVDRQRHQLKVSLEGTPFQIAPASQLPIRVSAQDANGAPLTGKAMVAVYAVDEGLLSLTDHAPPRPYEHFFGKRRLAFDIHDNYGRLLLRREGGDAYLLSRLIFNNFLSDQIVSRFALQSVDFIDGIATLPANGWSFDRFSGTVRLAAVVWNETGLGTDHKPLLIRDAVAMDLGVPRFLAPSDKPILPLTLENLEAAPGDYTVRVDGRGIAEVTLPGSTRAEPLRGDTFRITLPRGERRTTWLHLDVGSTVRDVDSYPISVELRGTGGQTGMMLSRRWTIRVRQPFVPTIVPVSTVRLEPAASVKLGLDPAVTQSMRWPSLQARFSASPFPIPATLPSVELATGPLQIDRLAWSAMLLAHRTPDNQPREILQRVLSDILALQHRSGGFLSHKLDVTTTGRETTSLIKSDGQADPFERSIWRTALALDVLRLAASATTSHHTRQIAAGAAFLKHKASDKLSSAGSASGTESRLETAVPAQTLRQARSRLRTLPSPSDAERPLGAAAAQGGRLDVELGQVTEAAARAAGMLVATGARIVAINDPSAVTAGLRPEDILLAIDGEPVGSPESATAVAARMAAGSIARIMVRRGTTDVTVPVTLGRATLDANDASTDGRDAVEASSQTSAPASRCTAELGYAAYVLARLEALDLAELRQFVDACRSTGATTLHSPLGQLMGAAALKVFGKPEDAKALWGLAAKDLTADTDADPRFDRLAYAMMLVTFAEKAAGDTPELARLLAEIAKLRQERAPQSLEAQAWMARANLERPSRQRVNVALSPDRLDDVAVIDAVSNEEVATRFIDQHMISADLSATNRGQSPVSMSLYARGLATSLKSSDSLSVRRRFYRLDGTEIAGTSIDISHNEAIFVVIEGRRLNDLPDATGAPLLLVDLMPAGFEILSLEAHRFARMSHQSSPATLPVARGELRHAEGRDDRYIAVIAPDQADGDFRVVYSARATTSGLFTLPQVRIEDLSRPELGADLLDERPIRVERK